MHALSLFFTVAWARNCKRLRSPGIDSASLFRLADRWWVNKSCRTGPARPPNIGWRNRFRGSLNVYKYGLLMSLWRPIFIIALYIIVFWREFNCVITPRGEANKSANHWGNLRAKGGVVPPSVFHLPIARVHIKYILHTTSLHITSSQQVYLRKSKRKIGTGYVVFALYFLF